MTQTMSGFYDQTTKSIKPIEMIKSKNVKNTSLITQLWFERAEKVINQLEHVYKLMEFFSYASLISFRFTNDYIPALKEEKDKAKKIRKNELIKEMRAFLELYSTYQLEYDYFSYKNQTTFSFFIVISYYL